VTKQVAARPVKSHKNQVVEVSAANEKEIAVVIALKLTRPEVTSASVIENWQKDTHDVNELVAELARQVDAVGAGNLRRAEGMLIAQAHALDNIFANLARRATNQQYLPQWEAYMRMAMKAQNQCRMTLETLATVKNPPVVFARQANINNGGQQQVNGGGTQAGTHVPPATAASSGNNGGFQSGFHALAGSALAHGALATTAPTDLLEKNDAQRMAPRAASTASRADPHMEAMGAVSRAA
jgi:hypothetical protein